MKTILPKKLKQGDSIMVIAPSSSLMTIDSNIRKTAEKRLSRNFKILMSKHIKEKDSSASASIKSRIDDLHSAFKDKSVKGIICARGGYNANTLLPYIDWKLIISNPKPIWGYSDITVLLNAIFAKTGLVTYSGPTFSNFGVKKNFEYSLQYFEKCLMNEDPFIPQSSKQWNERKTEPRKNIGTIVIQSGKAEGVIIGGNLCSLNLLQGTEYMPSLKDKILFIEDDDFGGDQSPLEFERNLESLLQLPYANTIRGIIFGRFQKGANMDMKKLRFILGSKNLLKNIPIVANLDFGHTNPMFTFPIGGTVRIEAKGKKSVIEILRH